MSDLLYIATIIITLYSTQVVTIIMGNGTTYHTLPQILENRINTCTVHSTVPHSIYIVHTCTVQYWSEIVLMCVAGWSMCACDHIQKRLVSMHSLQ